MTRFILRMILILFISGNTGLVQAQEKGAGGQEPVNKHYEKKKRQREKQNEKAKKDEQKRHEQIQDKKTRKRMKKNRKKAERLKKNKREPFFQRLFRKK